MRVASSRPRVRQASYRLKLEDWKPQPMSALGQKRTLKRPPNVRFTPKSGHRNSLVECPLCATSGPTASQQNSSLFDHVVGYGKDARWNCQAEPLCSLEVDHKFKFGWLQHG